MINNIKSQSFEIQGNCISKKHWNILSAGELEEIVRSGKKWYGKYAYAKLPLNYKVYE